MSYNSEKMHLLLFMEIQIKTPGYHFHLSSWQKVKDLVISIGSDMCLQCQWEYKFMSRKATWGGIY